MGDMTKTIELIKTCTFETDAVTNLSKAKQLIELKIKLQTGLFHLNTDYQKERNQFLISEEVQKGKNSEAREAVIELHFAGTKYDGIKDVEFLLGLIRGVECFNDNILIMFFGKKEKYNG